MPTFDHSGFHGYNNAYANPSRRSHLVETFIQRMTHQQYITISRPMVKVIFPSCNPRIIAFLSPCSGGKGELYQGKYVLSTRNVIFCSQKPPLQTWPIWNTVAMNSEGAFPPYLSSLNRLLNRGFFNWHDLFASFKFKRFNRR